MARRWARSLRSHAQCGASRVACACRRAPSSAAEQHQPVSRAKCRLGALPKPHAVTHSLNASMSGPPHGAAAHRAHHPTPAGALHVHTGHTESAGLPLHPPLLPQVKHVVIPSWYARPGYVRAMADLIQVRGAGQHAGQGRARQTPHPTRNPRPTPQHAWGAMAGQGRSGVARHWGREQRCGRATQGRRHTAPQAPVRDWQTAGDPIPHRPSRPQAELASGAFPDQGEVEIFFSAHGVPVSYIEEGEAPLRGVAPCRGRLLGTREGQRSLPVAGSPAFGRASEIPACTAAPTPLTHPTPHPTPTPPQATPTKRRWRSAWRW